MRPQNSRSAKQHFRSREDLQVWKSFLNAVVEAFAVFDPVGYMHYIDCKQEAARQAAVTPPGDTVQRYVDRRVAFSERMGVWQDNEYVYRILTFERAPSRQAFLGPIEGAIRYAKDALRDIRPRQRRVRGHYSQDGLVPLLSHAHLPHARERDKPAEVAVTLQPKVCDPSAEGL